jgi:apolipoprotein N-acyltransferase
VGTDRARALTRQRRAGPPDEAGDVGTKGAGGPGRTTGSRAVAPAPYASAVTEPLLAESAPPAAGAPAGPPGPRPHAGRRGLAVRLLAAAGSGVALQGAFPPYDLWFLAPLAVAGLTLVTRGVRARAGALLGLVFGLGFFVPHLQWSGVYVGPLPWFALATVEAAYVAAMGALLPAAWRLRDGRRGGAALLTLAVAGLWVLQEAVRGRWPFGGFPWGRVAFSQADSPAAGLAALGGAPLVTAAVAASGALLAWAAVRVATAGRDLRTALTTAGAVAAAVALPALGLAVPLPTDGEDIRVAAVQGNVPEPGLEFNAERRAVTDNHARATRDLAARVAAGATPQPDIVLWPENASDIDPFRNADAYQVIDGAVRAIGVPTLVGAVLQRPPDELENTGIVWTPGQGPGDRYTKQHPVPFGEYIPYRSFFRVFSDKVDLVAKNFVAGEGIGLLDLGPARIADVICFEVAYDSLVREPVAQGADLVVVQTNNATFGYTDESVQQLAMSRLRAIESGRSVVHISTVGISAVIEPDGTVVRRSGHFNHEVLEADVPLRTEQTPSTRLGATPEWVLAGLGLALALAGIRAGRGQARRRWFGVIRRTEGTR